MAQDVQSRIGMKLNKRRCEICKQEEGPGVECVSPFTLTLRAIGITSGDYAHPRCLKKAQKAFGSNVKAIAI